MDQAEGLWPVRVGLFPDESFVSWFARLAWAHGLSVAELYRTAMSGERLASKDLDRHLGNDLAARLEHHTGLDAQTIKQAGFHRWCGTVYAADDGAATIPWLPIAGRVHHRSAFGQQICPACLRDDRQRYLRAEWRLAFVTGCAIHKRLLLDRCPNCGSAVSLTAQPTETALPDRCGHCGLAYSTTALPRCSVAGLAVQRQLLAIAYGEWPTLGEYGHIHPILYFRIVRQLYRLVATGQHALALRRALTTDAEYQTTSSLPLIKEVERLNPRVRHALLLLAYRLLEDWPNRFVSACDKAGIYQRYLLKHKSTLPFAYTDTATRHLSRSTHSVNETELEQASSVLSRHRIEPSYSAMRELLGGKFQPKKLRSKLLYPKTPPGTHRYWKLDGVSPATRQAVRQAAHRSGENVGAWVDQALQRALSQKH